MLFKAFEGVTQENSGVVKSPDAEIWRMIA